MRGSRSWGKRSIEKIVVKKSQASLYFQKSKLWRGGRSGGVIDTEGVITVHTGAPCGSPTFGVEAIYSDRTLLWRAAPLCGLAFLCLSNAPPPQGPCWITCIYSSSITFTFQFHRGGPGLRTAAHIHHVNTLSLLIMLLIMVLMSQPAASMRRCSERQTHIRSAAASPWAGQVGPLPALCCPVWTQSSLRHLLAAATRLFNLNTFLSTREAQKCNTTTPQTGWISLFFLSVLKDLQTLQSEMVQNVTFFSSNHIKDVKSVREKIDVSSSSSRCSNKPQHRLTL